MEQAQIKHSELTFQVIVESTPNAIVLVNKEGKIAYVNNQTEKLFGYSRTELVGQMVERLIPKRYHENHSGFRNIFFVSPTVRAMGAGRELFAIRRDGTEFPIEIGLNPVVTVDGTLVLASIIDISERKKAEERFRLVVESAPNAMILVNKEGTITLVNNQTEKLFGYERKELIGVRLEVLIPERFRKQHPGHRNNFFSLPSVRAMGAGRELFGVRKDGSEIQVEIGLNPIETGEGQMVLASVIDITERKKAEERFRLVVESAPNAMILVNHEGVITLVNYQTEKLFGYDRLELIGTKLEMLIPERFRKHHPGHRNMFFTSPSVRAMGAGRELFGVRKNGTEIQVEIGLNPIETDEGQMVLASIIDITERKIQEASLIKQKELEIKNKELEQFAYLASHDLQEPLRTVSNYIETIEEDYGEQLDGQANNYLKIIGTATKRMSTLVRALLDFSHLGRNKNLVEADCKKIVQNALSDLENLIKTTGTTVCIDELPTLNVYETELRLVFQNLISNAIKFRRPGTKHEVHIGCEKMDGEWRFSVKDNGIGIGSQYFERIFYIFQRLHPDDEFEGHGIGLANCKKIVELHGGKIWIDSTLGSGSIFYFTIPNLN